MRKLFAALLLLPALAAAQVSIWTKPPGFAGTFPGTGVFDSIVIDSANQDVKLLRDAANTLAQRNGTNPQQFNTYNTFTDTSNYERGGVGWSGNQFTISSSAAGTGTSRSLALSIPGAAGSLVITTNGAVKWTVQNAGHLVTGAADNTYDIGASGATRPRNLYLGSSIKQVGGITTSGTVGAPAIVATGRLTAQTTAQASVSTFTVGAADGSFEVSANVLVTTATTHSFSVTVSYTDEGNTARVLTLNFTNLAGTFSTLIVNTGGAVPYESPAFHIRCKAATAIIIGTTGTFTTVTYNVEGIIRQLN